MRALALLWVLVPSVLHAQQVNEQRRTGPYLAVLDMYRSGRVNEAVHALVSLGDEGARMAGLALRGERLPDDPVALYAPVAVLLHTDAAAVLWPNTRARALLHMNAARTWVEAKPLRDGSFRSRWYLASGLLLAELGAKTGDTSAAFDHFDRARRRLPADLPLLIVSAWLEERAALAPADIETGRLAVTRKRRGLNRAADILVAALEVDPTSPEAALRLARVRMLTDEESHAQRVLEPLLAREDLSPRDAYLARLLLARLCERRGDGEGALAWYREAIARVPRAQSARMGLSRLLYATRDARTAADLLVPSLGPSADTGEIDPWVDYQAGHLMRAPMLLQELRKAVQQ